MDKTVLNTKNIVSGNAYENLSAYEKAWIELRNFELKPNLASLKNAADKLLKELETNKRHVNSYFCLAYIFFALNDLRNSYKYLSFGEKLCKKVPDGIQKFKNEELMPKLRKSSANRSSISQSDIRSKFANEIPRPEPVKARVSENSNFKRIMNQNKNVSRISKAYNQYNPETIKASRPSNTSFNPESVSMPQPIKAKISGKSKLWEV